MIKALISAAAVLALAGAVPLAASAQDIPSYAQGAPDQQGPDDAQIRGRVAGFDGGYQLSVRDDRGFVDNIQLHEGTIINPTGLTLAPGMVVSILGYNEGPFFSANEIDTPYTFYSGVPYYAGHPYGYYGSSFNLSFFFGNPGWWHGNYFHGGYRYDGGVRIYDTVRIHDVYHRYAPAGGYQGRRYVAPRENGGYHAGGHAYRPEGAHGHDGGGHDGGHDGGHEGDHR